MKATGIVRRMDDLGRVVIPKEVRRAMRFREGDALEIFTEENKVIFQKHEDKTFENIIAFTKNFLTKRQIPIIVQTKGEEIFRLNWPQGNFSPKNQVTRTFVIDENEDKDFDVTTIFCFERYLSDAIETFIEMEKAE